MTDGDPDIFDAVEHALKKFENSDSPRSDRPEIGRHLLLGTGINVLGGIIGQGLTFATLVIGLTRVGTEAYGIVALALSVTQLPLLLEKGLGMYMLGAANSSEVDERRTARLAVSAASYLALGFVTLLLGVFASHILVGLVIDVSPSLRPSAVRAFDLLAVGASVRAVLTFTSRALLAESRLPTLRLIELTRDAAGLVFTFVLVSSSAHSVVWVAFAALISDLMAGAVAVTITRSIWRVALRPGSIDADVRRELLQTCKPYLAFVVSGALVSRADPFVLGIVLGPSALALHAVALRVFQLFSGLIDLLCLGVISGTARLRATGELERIGGLYRKSSRYAALVIWPVAIAGIPFGDLVAERFGEFEQGEFVTVLRTVMVLVLVTVPISEAWAVVFGADQVQGLVRSQLLATSASLGLTVALAKPLGVPAAFVGSVAGTVATGFFLLPVVKRISGQPVGTLLSDMMRPGVLSAGLLMVLAALHVSLQNLVIEMVLGTVALGLYSVVGLWWAVFAEDRERVLSAWPNLERHRRQSGQPEGS